MPAKGLSITSRAYELIRQAILRPLQYDFESRKQAESIRQLIYRARKNVMEDPDAFGFAVHDSNMVQFLSVSVRRELGTGVWKLTIGIDWQLVMTYRQLHGQEDAVLAMKLAELERIAFRDAQSISSVITKISPMKPMRFEKGAMGHITTKVDQVSAQRLLEKLRADGVEIEVAEATERAEETPFYKREG